MKTFCSIREANGFVDDDLPSFEEVTTSVDALVSDEPITTIRQPPGAFDNFGRMGTPIVAPPPGLGMPISHPSPAISHSSLRTGTQTPPVAVPVVPTKTTATSTAPPTSTPATATVSSAAVSAAPSTTSTPTTAPSPLVSKNPKNKVEKGLRQCPFCSTDLPVAKDGKTINVSEAEKHIDSCEKEKNRAAASVTEAKNNSKENIQALAAESGLSKDIATAKAKAPKVLVDEDFPALNSPKVQAAATTPAPLTKTTVTKSKAVRKAERAAEKAAEKAAERERLEKEKAEKAEKEKADKEKAEKEKVVEKEKPAPLLVIPAVAPAISKPEPRLADKKPTAPVLNIAAATKVAQVKTVESSSATTEKSAHDRDSAFPALPTPTTASVASPLARTAKTLRLVSTPKTETPSTPANAAATSVVGSAARSVASISVRPETPPNEMISDSASIVSASVSASRTSSPPPSKIGSAPVRTTTKSQQRKARKEQLKKETAAVATQPVKPDLNEEIGPIIGRKKKQKKEKEKPGPATNTNTTPTVSRPATPAQKEKETPPPPPPKEVKEVKEESSTYRSTANETTTLTDDASPIKTRGVKETPKSDAVSTTPRTLPTPASIFQDLQKSGLVPEKIDDLPLFKPTSTGFEKSRNDHSNAAARENAARNAMTPTKSIVTDEDQAALLTGHPVRKMIDGVRILLTPNGDCIRNLTEEEEDRFLELQARIAETASSPAAFVSSRHEAGGGFSLIKGRAVPNGPPGYFPQAPGQYPTDPVNKIQREEAIYYINQYVLPRLNLNARDMSFPKAMSNWHPDQRGGNPAAAAGLSSLAPWMYGAGSPASPHDTDAVAPEISYPAPVSAFADAHGSYLDMPPSPSPSALDDPMGHKGAGLNIGGAPGPFGNVPLMSLEDAESALSAARKEGDKIEKHFNQTIRKNKRLLMAVGNPVSVGGGANGAIGGGGNGGGGGGAH